MFASARFLRRESCVAYWYREQKQSFFKVVNTLPRAEAMLPADAPIAIPDPLLALTFAHYAPPAMAAREVFVVDFPAVRAFRGDDSPEENLWAGRGYLYQHPIETLADFSNRSNQYLIVAAADNWLLRDLRIHRYEVRRPLDRYQRGSHGRVHSSGPWHTGILCRTLGWRAGIEADSVPCRGERAG